MRDQDVSSELNMSACKTDAASSFVSHAKLSSSMPQQMSTTMNGQLPGQRINQSLSLICGLIQKMTRRKRKGSRVSLLQIHMFLCTMSVWFVL